MIGPATDNVPALTAGRLLTRNVSLNLVGQLSYLIVGFVTIPILVRSLGPDRFGLLAIAWILIGYFSLFDVGLGRATTKLVSQALAEGNHERVRALAWTACAIMLAFGTVGAALLAGFAPFIVARLLKLPPNLTDEALASLTLLSSSIPAVILSAGLRGILEAAQRFGLVSASRTFLGFFTYLGPVVVLPFSARLTSVMAVLVLGRILYVLLLGSMCAWALPILRNPIFSRRVLRPLISFGGWITVSNIVGPLMVSMDRLLISSLASVAAAAYYAAPYEAVTRVWIVPAAVMGVVFPALAASFPNDEARARFLFTRTSKYLFFALFPVTLGIVALAPELLRVWLGTVFAHESTPVLQILALGVFLNSLAQVPFGVIQASGRPDITAKLHLMELVPYAIAVYWATLLFGISGTAVLWLVRVALDAAVLFAVSFRTLKFRFNTVASMVAVLLVSLTIVGAAYLPAPILIKTFYVCVIVCFFGWLTWHAFLSATERHFFASRARWFRSAKGPDVL